MRRRNSTWRRVGAAATALAMITACTSKTVIPKNEAVEQKEFYRHRMVVHVRDGNDLFTKRMSISDSTITIQSIREEGRTAYRDTTLVLNWTDVESIERIQFDDAKTIGALLFAAIPVYLIIAWHNLKIGGD